VKFRYVITYGKLTSTLMESTLEEITEELARHKKEAEKYGVKVLFWGSPWGVSEGLVIVYDSGESLDNYTKFMEAMTRARKQPFTDGRSNIVLEW